MNWASPMPGRTKPMSSADVIVVVVMVAIFFLVVL